MGVKREVAPDFVEMETDLAQDAGPQALAWAKKQGACANVLCEEKRSVNFEPPPRLVLATLRDDCDDVPLEVRVRNLILHC